MSSIRHAMSVTLVALAVCGCTQSVTYFCPSAAGGLTGGIGTCDNVDRGITFDAYLPDQERFISVTTFVPADTPMRLLVMIDKFYDPGGHGYWTERQRKEIESRDARLEAWRRDRTKPYSFSSNRIEFNWENGGHLSYTIPSLTSHGDHFEGTGNGDSNSSAFYLEPHLTGFRGDWFDVQFPSMSYDGVTVTPSRTRFARATTTVLPMINC